MEESEVNTGNCCVTDCPTQQLAECDHLFLMSCGSSNSLLLGTVHPLHLWIGLLRYNGNTSEWLLWGASQFSDFWSRSTLLVPFLTHCFLFWEAHSTLEVFRDAADLSCLPLKCATDATLWGSTVWWFGTWVQLWRAVCGLKQCENSVSSNHH